MVPAADDLSTAAALDLELEVLVDTALPPDVDRAALGRLIAFALTSEGASGRWTVAVVLTDDDRLRGLHRDFMGLDTPTDVMTFPHADGDGPPTADRGGDIVVSVERAAAQAGDYGHTTGEEVRFLIVHGLLHLSGWTDATDADRARMLDRQGELIASHDDAMAMGG